MRLHSVTGWHDSSSETVFFYSCRLAAPFNVHVAPRGTHDLHAGRANATMYLSQRTRTGMRRWSLEFGHGNIAIYRGMDFYRRNGSSDIRIIEGEPQTLGQNGSTFLVDTRLDDLRGRGLLLR